MNKREYTTKQEISINQLYAAKCSITGRLARLRVCRNRYTPKTSPIAVINAFETYIDDMERTLNSMKNRIDNAKITIEI